MESPTQATSLSLRRSANSMMSCWLEGEICGSAIHSPILMVVLVWGRSDEVGFELAKLYIEQPRVMLSRVHVALSHPTLWLRTREGDFDHPEVVHRQALNELRICAVQTFKQLCTERRRVPVAAEQFLIVEKQIDGHPEGAGVL
jgi:hypothetical protein